MKKIKRRKRKQNKIETSWAINKSLLKIIVVLLITGLNLTGLLAIGETISYYFDSEASNQNVYQAGVLDFDLTSPTTNFISPDIVSLIGASAALSITGTPFNGPIGAARVGYKDGQYILNPSATVCKEESDLDLIVAGTADAVLMVESQAKLLSEDVMLGAVMYGHERSEEHTSELQSH